MIDKNKDLKKLIKEMIERINKKVLLNTVTLEEKLFKIDLISQLLLIENK